MSGQVDLARAGERLRKQIESLGEIRNAGPRDQRFKVWRQDTLTLLQRLWPGDHVKAERFRRIPFSAPAARSDRTAMREYFERGCKEAELYLEGLAIELGVHAGPIEATRGPEPRDDGEAPVPGSADPGPVTMIPPAPRASASPAGSPKPRASAGPAPLPPPAPAVSPPAAPVQAESVAPVDDAPPPAAAEPPPPPPPARKSITFKPAAAAYETLPIAFLGPERRKTPRPPGSSAPPANAPPAPPRRPATPPAAEPAAAAPPPVTPPAAAPTAAEPPAVTPPAAVPPVARSAAPPAAAPPPFVPQTPPPPPQRATLPPPPAAAPQPVVAPAAAPPAAARTAVPPHEPPPAPAPAPPQAETGEPQRRKMRLKDMLGFSDAPAPAGIEPVTPHSPPSSAAPPPAPPPYAVRPPVAPPMPAADELPHDPADDEQPEPRRDLAAKFVLESPVLQSRAHPLRHKPHAEATPDSAAFTPATPAAQATPAVPHTAEPAVRMPQPERGVELPPQLAAEEVYELAARVTEFGVPPAQAAILRAALIDLGRQLETPPVQWAALRETVALAIEHPELARRLLPQLLPYLSQAA